MIHIVDYGMGNLRSVQKAFEKLGCEAEIISRGADLRSAENLVLPGVGAFRDAIAELKKHDFVAPIRDHIAADRPFLGICLGLQLLFDVSEEDGEWEGLGVIPGRVVRFENEPGLKIPHMGWNTLEAQGQPAILSGLSPEAWFYFVHSYHVVPEDESVVAARTTHGQQFVSVVERGNLAATQFHPEKSQRTGQALLRNFARIEQEYTA